VTKKSNGRPTISEQITNEKRLQKYFEKGFSASFTAVKTGKNIKTVCDYFNKFAKEITESEGDDFILRQRRLREQTILSYDRLIFESYESLDNINSEIKKHQKKDSKIHRDLFDKKLKTIKEISTLIEKKGTFSLEMLLAEELERNYKEVAKK